MTIRQKLNRTFTAGLVALALAGSAGLSGGCVEHLPLYVDYTVPIGVGVTKMYIVDDKEQVVCDLSKKYLEMYEYNHYVMRSAKPLGDPNESCLIFLPEDFRPYLNKNCILIVEFEKGDIEKIPIEEILKE